MTEAASPSPPRWLAFTPLVGALIAIGSVGWNVAGTTAQVRDNTRRIEKLEARQEARDSLLATIDVRTARIEGKLELIGPKGEGR